MFAANTTGSELFLDAKASLHQDGFPVDQTCLDWHNMVKQAIIVINTFQLKSTSNGLSSLLYLLHHTEYRNQKQSINYNVTTTLTTLPGRPMCNCGIEANTCNPLEIEKVGFNR